MKSIYAFFFTNYSIPFEHPLYGWYHLLWILIAIVGSILLVHFLGKKHDDRICDQVVYFFGIMLLVLEVYKQIFCLINKHPYDNNDIPFQFCSMPMYIMAIAPKLKPGKIKDALYKFLAYYGTLAGISVMVYPTVISEALYFQLMIHTMIWHVSMIIVGIFIISSKQYGRNRKRELKPGLMVLLSLTTLATMLNFTLPQVLGKSDTINFFYLSYYHGSTLPILDRIYDYGDGLGQWLLLVICYLLAFLLGTALLYQIIVIVKRKAFKVKHP